MTVARGKSSLGLFWPIDNQQIALTEYLGTCHLILLLIGLFLRDRRKYTTIQICVFSNIMCFQNVYKKLVPNEGMM